MKLKRDGRARELGLRLVSAVAAALLRLLGATWRVSVEGTNPLSEGGGPCIGAFWHRNILLATWYFRDQGHGVSVSRSRDGDLISAVILRLGYQSPARGSSSRGGSASLRSLVRTVRGGSTVSVVVDGPRGPARRSKVGIAVLAQLTGAPIYPVAFSAKPAWRFASWDGTLLPLPFARVLCAFDTPIYVEKDLEEEARVCDELDDRFNALTDRLDDRCGLDDPNRPSPREAASSV